MPLHRARPFTHLPGDTSAPSARKVQVLHQLFERRCSCDTQGRKTSRSCRVPRWEWSAFYAIAELFELLDHSGSARTLGFGAHLRAPFLVADPLMQNHPEQSIKSVGDGPDGLLV